MSAAWKAWLPPGALADGTDRALADMFRQWSERWFAHAAVNALSGLSPPSAAQGLPSSASRWHHLDDGIALEVEELGRARIAEMMLDAPLDAGPFTQRDRYVADRLAAACIDDLCARLVRVFKLPASSQWRAQAAPPLLSDPSVCAVGAEHDKPLMRLMVETHLLVDLRKCSLPIGSARGALQPIAAGLANQPVSISALLGRCDLTLSDLEGLTEGDVLVLDRELTRPLDLALDGQVKAGRCVLEQDGAELRLKILEPISG